MYSGVIYLVSLSVRVCVVDLLFTDACVFSAYNCKVIVCIVLHFVFVDYYIGWQLRVCVVACSFDLVWMFGGFWSFCLCVGFVWVILLSVGVFWRVCWTFG